jgi:FtsP/CotA-like multicopper oxidase with cupredoxin domain
MPGHVIYRIGGDMGLLTEPEAVQAIDVIPNPKAGLPATSISARDLIGGPPEMSSPDLDLGVMLVPGERAEVIITPIGKAGETTYLEWHDYPRGHHLVAEDNGDLVITHDHLDGTRPAIRLVKLNFDAASTGNETEYTPAATLRPASLINTQNASTLDVTFGHSLPNSNGDIMFFATMINGTGIPFADITEDEAIKAQANNTYVWEVTNMTQGDHPFHTHGFPFQVLSYEYIDLDNPANNRIEVVNSTELQDTLRIPKRPGARGRSRTITRLAVNFNDTGREGLISASGKIPDGLVSGGWMVHCHILEHAKYGMATYLSLSAP